MSNQPGQANQQAKAPRQALSGTPDFGPATESPVPMPDAQTTILLALQKLLQQQEVAGAQLPRAQGTGGGHPMVKWSTLEPLNTAAPAEVDSFFVRFERLMVSSFVPDNLWSRRFFECPGVGEAVKALFDNRGSDPLPYSAIRTAVLKKHGPTFPVAFFRHQLHAVRGTGRESVRSQLDRLLILHNRAADDQGREQMTPTDLCVCFAEAFPPEASAELKKFYAAASEHPDPLEHLFRLAPDDKATRPAPRQPSSPAVDAAFFASPNDKGRKRRQPGRKPASAFLAEEPSDAFIAAVAERLRAQGPSNDRFRPSQPRPFKQPRTGGCSGCSGNCRARQECPAWGQTCHNCNGRNHYASACRSQKQEARPPMAGGNRSFRGVRNPDSRS